MRALQILQRYSETSSAHIERDRTEGPNHLSSLVYDETHAFLGQAGYRISSAHAVAAFQGLVVRQL